MTVNQTELQHLHSAVKTLLLTTGDDPNREGLQETPARFAAAWKFYTKGYSEKPEMVLKTFKDGAEDYNEMVFQGAVPVWSLCEHHLSPFFGVAHISYLPQGRVVGLSKFARLVEVFSRRLQVQERLTVQIAEALFQHLKPRGVGVVLRCRHTCMEARGVRTAGSMTYTSCLLGNYRTDPTIRNEFLQFVGRADAERAAV